MRQLVQIALTRTEAERREYLQQFHAGHHEREAGPNDSFLRWAYSDPRLEEVTGTIGHGVNQLFFVACLVVVVLGPIAAILQPLYWRLPRDQRPHLRRRTATSS